MTGRSAIIWTAELDVSAMTVYLNDGSIEIIFAENEKDVFLERLIREKLGDDAARCFIDCIAGLKDELKWQAESAREQECIADGYSAMCREALDNFGEVIKLLDAPRLNRKELKQVAQIGYDALYNNL